MGRYPLLLDLTGRPAVVVGGGPVALRRARGLLAAGAPVTVVAPDVVPELSAEQGVSVVARPYADGDLAGAWVAHACTSDPAVNAAVAVEAERLRIPCVRADAAGPGSARVPAATVAGGLMVTVSTAGEGADPGRATAVRDAVALLLDTGGLPARRARPGPGRVALVGGGPGDPELVTVRGRR
ncbi:MAG TPA: NAD(P)-dependent oxidoreductase, partial [Mycobacteriales bacterium]